MGRLFRFCKLLSAWKALAAITLIGGAYAAQASPQDRVTRWAPDVIRAGHLVWGLSSPTALFLAQIKQESGGNPHVCSAYACGLTQFTDSTATWIQQIYGTELGSGGVFNPRWAVRAMVRYDKHLFDRVAGVTECDKFKFTLSAYNGGLGWVNRDKKLALKNGKNPLIYGDVAPFNSGRAKPFFNENRIYPNSIIYRHQPIYKRFGRTTCI